MAPADFTPGLLAPFSCHHSQGADCRVFKRSPLKRARKTHEVRASLACLPCLGCGGRHCGGVIARWVLCSTPSWLCFEEAPSGFVQWQAQVATLCWGRCHGQSAPGVAASPLLSSNPDLTAWHVPPWLTPRPSSVFRGGLRPFLGGSFGAGHRERWRTQQALAQTRLFLRFLFTVLLSLPPQTPWL